MFEFTVKSGDEPLIILPEAWLKRLNLKEGEQITLSSLPRKSRRADPEAIEAFMSLIGIFADAPEFEAYILEHRKEWDEWGRQLEESALTQDS